VLTTPMIFISREALFYGFVYKETELISIA